MMYKKILPIAVVALLSAATVKAEMVVEWGTTLAAELYDSYGYDMDSSFVWQLGVFDNGFVPTEANVDLWAANWVVFDQADFFPYDGVTPQYPSVVGIATQQDDGTSSSSYAPADFIFNGLDAYVWAFKDDQSYKMGLEWLIYRHEDWKFADDPVFPPVEEVEWLNSELIYDDPGNDDVPLWGNQNGIVGLGYASNPQLYPGYESGNLLQSYTLIPEPGSVTVGVLLVSLVGLRHWKKRKKAATS